MRTDLRALVRATPRAQRLTSVVALVLLGLVAALALGPLAPTRAAGGPTAAAAGARFGPAVLAELNRIRRAHGLPSVAADARMGRTAAAHSRDMARRGYFAHGAWGSRVARAAGSAHDLGEVIGWRRRGTPRAEAKGVVRDWLNSPPHRVVLLDGEFRRVGIGRAPGHLSGVAAAIYTVDWASAR